ncbi:MAG: hypothetical protein WC326_13830 [Candidatus Delongbacteria bacterium]
MTPRALLLRRHADYLALAAVLLAQPVLTLPPGSGTACWILAGLALLLGLAAPAPTGARGPAAWTALAAAGLAFLLPGAWRPGLALLLLGGLAGLLRHAGAGRVAAAGRRAGLLFLLGSLLSGPLQLLLAMFESWPPAGWAAWLTGRLAGLQVALQDGSLVLQTPVEHQPFPLAPEWTGFVIQLLLAGLALAWWAGRPRRLPALAAALVLGQLWLGTVFLWLCQVGAGLGFFELPWQPLLWIAAGLPPLWLAARLLPAAPSAPPVPRPAVSRRRRGLDLALGLTGLILLTAGLLGEDRGQAKAGRLLIDDGHSDWEWVETPMTPDVFGSKSTYNYHGLGRLLAQYYDLTVTHDPLTPARLAQTDVLVLKTPTRPYAAEEIAAVHEFVRAGGGLYLISDHTNIFGMSTWLNQVAEPLGFTFNSDAVFSLWSRSDQLWRQESPLPHPAVAGLAQYRFLTSCSIRPGWGTRVAMAGAQAGSALVCYHESNFFNPHPPRAEQRFGRLIQLASTRVGRGRVLGFTDSTTYSNFAVFWPGRLEQLLAALDWLNRRNSALPWTWLAGLGGLLLCGWLALGRRLAGRDWVPLALLAALFTLPALRALGRPVPPELRRPLPAASLDAALSQVKFPLEDKLDPLDPRNVETFFIWLHRSGLLPVLTQGSIPPQSRLHIVLNPARVPGAAAQAEQRAFLERGGTLLVALRPSQYTAGLNAWLAPYGVGFGTRLVQQQAVALDSPGDSVWVDEALSVEGGRPFVWDRMGQALATEVAVGRGRLVVSGLADGFSNAHLGTYDSVPTGLALEYLRLYYRHVGLQLAADQPAAGTAEFPARE